MTLYLAPGSGGGPAALQRYLGGLARRGVQAAPVRLPRGRAETAVAAYLRQSGTGPEVVIGGRSFGGRVASLAAAVAANRFAGLVLFAYPLHRPGHPEDLRTSHWPLIRCPVLVVQGDRDPFGRPDLLRREARKLADVEVAVVPGAGHTFGDELDAALDVAVEWLRRRLSPSPG